MNQKAMLLNHLKKAPITKLEALKLYGIWNSGDTIFNLRNAGHDIITTMKKDGKKRYAVYSLKLK